MNYGNANDLIRHCPRCGMSIDKHEFSLIRSDKKTEELAKKLQGMLHSVASRSADNGFEPMRTSCMVGAATAKIGSAVYQWVTISGGDTAMLAQMDHMGKDVVVITAHTADPLTTIRGEPLVMRPTAHGRNRDYPVGSCAAQSYLWQFSVKRKRANRKFQK